jgi:hypothetical protein
MDNRNGEPPVTAGTTPSVEDSARRVKDVADDAATRIKDAAGGAIKDAKNAAMHGVEDARTKAGDVGHTTASRFRDFASQVESDMPWLSGAFTKSAAGLDGLTDSLTRGDVSQSLNGLSDFARRQPAIFLGASVALGFALARVGKTALEDAAPAMKTNSEAGPKPTETAGTPYPTSTGG